MKTIKVNEKKLKKEIRKAVSEMKGFSWSGWKIDVLLDPETGNVWRSCKNTNNAYTTSIPLLSVYSHDEKILNETEWQFNNFVNGGLNDVEFFYDIKLDIQ